MLLSGSKRGVIVCITGELTSINLEKHFASANIEKNDSAIDPRRTPNSIFD